MIQVAVLVLLLSFHPWFVSVNNLLFRWFGNWCYAFCLNCGLVVIIHVLTYLDQNILHHTLYIFIWLWLPNRFCHPVLALLWANHIESLFSLISPFFLKPPVPYSRCGCDPSQQVVYELPFHYSWNALSSEHILVKGNDIALTHITRNQGQNGRHSNLCIEVK